MDDCSGLAALRLINSHTAAAGGLTKWVVTDDIRGHISISGACLSPIIGLVAVKPAAGFVQPGWALFVGVITSIVIISGLLRLKRYMQVDDTPDVTMVHDCSTLNWEVSERRWSCSSLRVVLLVRSSLVYSGCSGSILRVMSTVHSNGYRWVKCTDREMQLMEEFSVAFSSVCTAGILLPLDWIRCWRHVLSSSSFSKLWKNRLENRNSLVRR